MLKKLLCATVLGAGAMNGSLVFAADDARAAIHITANIPNQQFHVQPRDPEFGKDEVMQYDPITDRLRNLRHTYDVKNTEGSVHAYIEGGPAWLSSGSAKINLNVSFNNKFLHGFPQEVVDDATSTPGTQVEMVIGADRYLDGNPPGLYTGNFTVIFDAVPRVAL
ncbi:adhesin [Pseudomonas sp. SWRI92]|uniref:Adhesin n=1 Tax=Pseudomonas marvdashtae TaxID=2745500 RepID=A0A923JQT8_9PSED|nr:MULTISPECIES: CS1 type fimbrial major subunit [Pseudomonas]MBC3376843.1 adhesin [Pseudomonas sp. SWRI92]MBV4550527.1 fimbrial protein [Pseudomonas marvdashtae]